MAAQAKKGGGAKKTGAKKGGARKAPAKKPVAQAKAAQPSASVLKDTIRDAWYAGLGALSLSEEKAREILNSLVEKGKLSEREATKFFNDFRKRVEKNRKDLEKWVEERIKQVVPNLKIPSVEEWKKEVQQRLKKLEDVVEKIRTGKVTSKK